VLRRLRCRSGASASARQPPWSFQPAAPPGSRRLDFRPGPAARPGNREGMKGARLSTKVDPVSTAAKRGAQRGSPESRVAGLSGCQRRVDLQYNHTLRRPLRFHRVFFWDWEAGVAMAEHVSAKPMEGERAVCQRQSLSEGES
jgi:hypothetical protein